MLFRSGDFHVAQFDLLGESSASTRSRSSGEKYPGRLSPRALLLPIRRLSSCSAADAPAAVLALSAASLQRCSAASCLTDFPPFP